MTNNPTIDGVSRELLNQIYFELDAGTPSIATLAAIRALLDAAPHEHEWEINAEGTATVCYCGARSSDAPAVERQEAVAPFYISVEDWNLLVRGDVEIASVRISRTRRSKFTESLFAHPSALQSTIVQLQAEQQLLQSTVARYLDRITELESGMGEPVAWANGEQLKLCAASPREVQPNNPMMHNLPRNIAGSALKTDYCNTPLFTAPPAVKPPNALREHCKQCSEVVKTWPEWKQNCLGAPAAQDGQVK